MKRVFIPNGTRFGRLVVIRHAGWRVKPTCRRETYRCECDCGRQVTATANDLRSRATKSCGCLQADNRRNASRKHGLSRKHPLYPTWNTNEAQRRYNRRKAVAAA